MDALIQTDFEQLNLIMDEYESFLDVVDVYPIHLYSYSVYIPHIVDVLNAFPEGTEDAIFEIARYAAKHNIFFKIFGGNYLNMPIGEVW